MIVITHTCDLTTAKTPNTICANVLKVTMIVRYLFKQKNHQKDYLYKNSHLKGELDRLGGVHLRYKCLPSDLIFWMVRIAFRSPAGS
jgi:hypothetical protein